MLGYVGHYLRARTPTKDSEDDRAGRDRVEALEHLRWSCELAVSPEESRRLLGVRQLRTLLEDPSLTKADLRRVQAALTSALAPELHAWDTDKALEARLVELDEEVEG